MLIGVLTAASKLIALHWKSEEELLLRDWVNRVREKCLIGKLAVASKYRARNDKALSDFIANCTTRECILETI